MAAGVPAVGIETPAASRILKGAGYLASTTDVRGLAAACITLLVETSVADELRQKGLTIARNFHLAPFIEGMAQAIVQTDKV